MEQFFYNSLIQYIMMYYKSALVFSITVCCLNVLAGKLYVFYETKNTPVLFFFAIYIYAVLAVTILSRAGIYISEVNLRPLANFYKTEWEKAFFYTNIILFFPMPVFLYSLYPALRNFFKCILLGFIISTGIEISQFILHCGWCDIDDVISNILGMALGWLCSHTAYQVKKHFSNDS